MCTCDPGKPSVHLPDSPPHAQHKALGGDPPFLLSSFAAMDVRLFIATQDWLVPAALYPTPHQQPASEPGSTPQVTTA